MNAARKRRKIIKQRADDAAIRRYAREAEQNCEHGMAINGIICPHCHPDLYKAPETVEAQVYLKDSYIGIQYPPRIPVKLPLRDTWATVRGMMSYGFWYKSGDGCVYIPGREILRIGIFRDN